MSCRCVLLAVIYLISAIAVADPSASATAEAAAPTVVEAGEESSNANQSSFPSRFTNNSSNNKNGDSRPEVGSGVVTANPVTVVAVLLLMVFFILAVAWLLRRVGAVPAMSGGQAMRILSALSVGGREKVLLIDVGGKQVLIGVAPGRVSHLQSFDEPVVAPADMASVDFSTTIKKMLQRSASGAGLQKSDSTQGTKR